MKYTGKLFNIAKENKFTDQNLSEKEMKQRLEIGAGFEIAAALTHFNQDISTMFWIFAIG